jgi:hypothetical protein
MYLVNQFFKIIEIDYDKIYSNSNSNSILFFL